MACDAQTLINAAAANGYYALEDRSIKMAILYMLCSSGAGGAGLSGSGSPQGVVSANPGQTYVDTAGHTFWIKETGSGTNTGWVQYV